MKHWPAIGKQLLAVFPLSVAAVFGSGWAMLYCYHFGSPFRTELDTVLARFQIADTFDHEGPDEAFIDYGAWLDSSLPLYWSTSAVALAWIIAMGVYFWLWRSSRSGLIFGGITARPVCIRKRREFAHGVAGV